MGDLGAFRGARRALRRKPVPRWQMGEARAVLGEGGYGKVFPVSDDVVVKVVAINGDYTDETDMRAAGELQRQLVFFILFLFSFNFILVCFLFCFILFFEFLFRRFEKNDSEQKSK